MRWALFINRNYVCKKKLKNLRKYYLRKIQFLKVLS